MKIKLKEYQYYLANKYSEYSKIFMIFEITLLLLFFILFPFVRKDILIFSFYTIIYFYIITFKIKSIEYLGLSTIISLIWVYVMKDFYIYTPDMTTLFGLNIYTLLAWSLGLFALRELYDYFKPKKILSSILIITILYWIILITLETVSYHILGFKVMNNYPGIPICDCIHGPKILQTYYISIGPIYYVLTLLLDKFIKKR
ncbi:MAG: hypothetical protein KatS3mg002_0181 [Candidatus Woesearchaeota archaeon]|nr:MAG: hypothetical protein KatS3mg002_0181 [Candidatus Woesearchaeota archaeon]